MRDTPVRWGTVAVGFAAAFTFCALFGFWLQRSGNWGQGLGWERTFMLSLDHDLPNPYDTVLLFVPWLGTNFTLLPLTAGIALWMRRHGRNDVALHVIVAELGCLALNQVPKALFDRPRPELWPHRGQYAQASYPSGHMIASISVLFTLAAVLHRERGWRWPYAVAGTILLISLHSRLYLGVHWPSDVIAGIVMGVIWLLATLRAFPRNA